MHRLEAHPEAELVEGLEPDQIVAAAASPLPRYTLRPIASAGLWVIRVFVLLLSAIVTYTFIVSLLRAA